MSSFAKLFVFSGKGKTKWSKAKDWEAKQWTTPGNEDTYKFPKRATPGDLAVVYGDAAKTYVAHLPERRFGKNPLIFHYHDKKWDPLIVTENIAYHRECLAGEQKTIDQTLDGKVGDLLIGMKSQPPGGQLNYLWWIRSGDGTITPVVHEDTLVLQNDNPVLEAQWHNQISLDVTIPENERRSALPLLTHMAQIEKLKVKFQQVAADLDQARSDSRKRALDLIGEIIGNMAPGPVAGTLIPLDLAVLVGDLPFVQAACPAGANVNLMTNAFQKTMSADAEKGLGSVGSANAFLQAIGSFFVCVSQAKAWREEHLAGGSSGAMKTAATETFVNGFKSLKGMFDGINVAVTLAGRMGTVAGQATAGAGGFAGVLLGAFAFVRSIRKAHHARERLKQLRAILAQDDLEPDFRGCIEYMVEKLTSRTGKQIATGVSAAVGAVGGTILTVTAIIGIANAWNPVGWAIIGAGTLVAIGVGGYLLYRRYKRVQNRNERRQEYGVGSPQDLALKLVAIAGDPSHNNSDHAYTVLVLLGVDQVQNQLSQNPASIQPIVKLITRRFHG